MQGEIVLFEVVSGSRVGTISEDGALGFKSLVKPSLTYGSLVWGHLE